jgi:hypothetical protein
MRAVVCITLLALSNDSILARARKTTHRAILGVRRDSSFASTEVSIDKIHLPKQNGGDKEQKQAGT